MKKLKRLNKKGKIALYLHLINHSEYRIDEELIYYAEDEVEGFYAMNGEGKVELNFCSVDFNLLKKYIKGE